MEWYDKLDAQCDWLHGIGVDNAAVQELEGGLQVVQNQTTKLMAQFNDQQEENASLKASLASIEPTTSADDNSTIVLQMTVMSTHNSASIQ